MFTDHVSRARDMLSTSSVNPPVCVVVPVWPPTVQVASYFSLPSA